MFSYYSGQRRRTKMSQRAQQGLCVECGKKPCDCRKFRKNIRKHVPEPLKSAKIVTRGRREDLSEARAERIGKPTLNKKFKGDWRRKMNVLP